MIPIYIFLCTFTIIGLILAVCFIKPYPRTNLKKIILPSPSTTTLTKLPIKEKNTPPCLFEVDAVVTWVDSTDSQWVDAKQYYSQIKNPNQLAEGKQSFRFENVGELYYCLKGIQTYLPWIRTVHLVTMRPQRPPYLNEFPKVRVVHHDEIFEVYDSLPTFNSNAIETSLYRIAGLADHFIYFNDDFFIGKPLTKNFFFIPEGQPQMYNRNHINIYQQSNHSMLKDYGLDFISSAPAHQAIPLKKEYFETTWTSFPVQLMKTQKTRFREKNDIWIIGLIFQMYDMGWFGSVRSQKMISSDQLFIFMTIYTPDKIKLKLKNYEQNKTYPALICINDIKLEDEFHQHIWNKFISIYEKKLREMPEEFTDQDNRKKMKWPPFLSKGRGFRKSVKKTKRGTFIKSWTKTHRKRYLREKIAYQQLERTGIVPRLLNYNDKTLEIEIEDAGIPLRDIKHLRKLNKIEKEVPDWREQIQDIVQILYQYNIGHGDWSGANILYKNGRFKIIDFDKGHMPSEKYFENVRIPVLPKKNQSLKQYLKSIEGMDKFIDSSVANNLENI